METKEQIVKSAKKILGVRAKALIKDVRYCVIDNKHSLRWPAPFPALLYCFSTIDFLGALYSGIADKTSGITGRSLNYMINVMKYSKDDAELVQNVFRHRIVHLAQPEPEVEINGISYKWGYHHNKPSYHLKKEMLFRKPETYRFWISILTFAQDIKKSIFNPGGYLEILNTKETLRTNFVKARKQIYKI